MLVAKQVSESALTQGIISVQVCEVENYQYFAHCRVPCIASMSYLVLYLFSFIYVNFSKC